MIIHIETKKKYQHARTRQRFYGLPRRGKIGCVISWPHAPASAFRWLPPLGRRRSISALQTKDRQKRHSNVRKLSEFSFVPLIVINSCYTYACISESHDSGHIIAQVQYLPDQQVVK